MLKGFKAEDINKVADFMNFLAKKAKFNDISIEENIKLFKFLNFIQVELMPKMESMLVDNLKIKEALPTQESVEEEKQIKSAKGKK